MSPGQGATTSSMLAVADEPWWKQAVVYQVYLRSFADSNGDGIGDLEGLRQRLDYIQRLGVAAIWLSPVCRSPQDDNGYDVSDYEDIDPLYGSLAEFDALLEDVHARDMRLILDTVVNHTSDQHPWFAASRSDRGGARRDWYWWRPARAGMVAGQPGAEPNNWGSFFSGPAWTLDAATSEYYLHLFSSHQPDLNWECQDVRQAVYSMMRWWLDRGIDGFRLDVINMISKHPDLPDGPPTLPDGLGDGRLSFVSGPRVHEYLREMHREVFAGRRRLLNVGETPAATIEEARRFTDPRRMELDMVFQFEHMALDQGVTKWDIRPRRLTDLKASLGRWQAGLADAGWNSLYWGNHDQPRAVSRFGSGGAYRERSAKLLATVLHLHRGTPYVFQGEELGMTNTTFLDIDDLRDIESRNYLRGAVDRGEDAAEAMSRIAVMGRDHARTPMQWDTSPHAGFTTGTPWIGVNPNHTEINAASAIADADSVYHWYRRLAELRKREPAIALGDFTMLLPNHEQIYSFVRRYGLDEILAIANFSDSPVGVELGDSVGWTGMELLLANCDVTEAQGKPSRLHPWEVRVYKRTREGSGDVPSAGFAARQPC